jgi:uridine kinase
MRRLPNLRIGIEAVVAAARRLMAEHQRPIVIALDGPSGSGKTTGAQYLQKELEATVIPCDDFFASDIPDPKWDQFSVIERYEKAIDWRRMRREAIEPLLAGETARWRTYDFAAGLREDGTYGLQDDFIARKPAKVIILEGAFSSRVELSDLVDITVLVDAPIEVRNARLRAREEAKFLERWHKLWDPVEEYYYSELRPAESFDFVLES